MSEPKPSQPSKLSPKRLAARATLGLLAAGGVFAAAKSHDTPPAELNKLGYTYVVDSDDTATGIAKRYAEPGSDIRDDIQAIEKQLPNEGDRTGSTIVLPADLLPGYVAQHPEQLKPKQPVPPVIGGPATTVGAPDHVGPPTTFHSTTRP